MLFAQIPKYHDFLGFDSENIIINLENDICNHNCVWSTDNLNEQAMGVNQYTLLFMNIFFELLQKVANRFLRDGFHSVILKGQGILIYGSRAHCMFSFVG